MTATSTPNASRSRSPLNEKPLPHPGQSIQDELERTAIDDFLPFFIGAIFSTWAAGVEWLAVWLHSPRHPWLYTCMAGMAIPLCAWRFRRVWPNIGRLRMARDGERVVGQRLEALRTYQAQVFHDVPGKNFNLDHVVLTPRGFFVIETKTWSKPRRAGAKVRLVNDTLEINGFSPDRDPIDQVQAGARWLANLLQESCGKTFPVRGVVLLPGWYIEPMTREWKDRLPWVLEPKALAKFLNREPMLHSMEDVYLAAFHLSRYVCTTKT